MTTVGSLLGKPFVNGLVKATGTLNKKVLNSRPSQLLGAMQVAEGHNNLVNPITLYSTGLNNGRIVGDKFTREGKMRVLGFLKSLGLSKDATIKDFLSAAYMKWQNTNLSRV